MRVAVAGALVVILLAVAALVAPVLPIGSPTAIGKDHALRAPTAREPFGILQPVFPLSLAAQWGARHGAFPRIPNPPG